MKDEHIVRYTVDELNALPDDTDWERVDSMTDEEIEADALADPDALPLTEDELNQFHRVIYDGEGNKIWEDDKTIGEWRAERGEVPPVCELVLLDSEVLEWFKSQGSDYQSRINEALHAYIKAQTAA